jgi:hypothetical protein
VHDQLGAAVDALEVQIEIGPRELGLEAHSPAVQTLPGLPERRLAPWMGRRSVPIPLRWLNVSACVPDSELDK